jgi:preprotein translocase subunit YajC
MEVITMSFVSLFTETNTNTTSGGSLMPIIMIVLLVVVFFFMYRSNKKQERQANDMRNNLEVGDEVTTIGGIVGEIVSIKDETVTIETSRDRTKIRFLKTAIRNVDVSAAQKRGEVPVDEKAEKSSKIEKAEVVDDKKDAEDAE